MVTPSHQSARIAGPAPIASPAWFKRSQHILGRDRPTAYLFIALTVLLLGTVKAYPFLRALWFSVHNVVGFRVGSFVGLYNYIGLWSDERFTRSIGVTLTFTVASVVLKLGMSAALLLHNVPRWGAVFGGLLLVPYVVPEVVRALAWRMILDPLFGGLNYIPVNVLGMLASAQPWLSDPVTALPAVILVNVWAGTPFMIILLLAGLKGIDAEQYDAASVDGAGRWRRFLHVTLPGLQYVLIVGTLEQFVFLFTRLRFAEWYRNTALVSLASTLVSVLVASLGAYGIVRLRWRGASTLGETVLVANLMPGALMVIPMYIILAQLRLINTHWALLVTYPSFVLPFATWLMMGYYRSIPEEVEDTALIDGCPGSRRSSW